MRRREFVAGLGATVAALALGVVPKWNPPTEHRLACTHPEYFRPGDLLMTPAREIMRVTSVSSYSLTVVRG